MTSRATIQEINRRESLAAKNSKWRKKYNPEEYWKYRRPSQYYHFPEDINVTETTYNGIRRSLLDNHLKGSCRKGYCRKWVGTEEVPFRNVPCLYLLMVIMTRRVLQLHSGCHDGCSGEVVVSLSLHPSPNRFPLIKNTTEVWKGRYCGAMIVHEEDIPAIAQSIMEYNFSSRVMFIMFSPPANHTLYNTFPLNFLRNLCIRHAETSHFLFFDTDLIPSCEYHPSLLRLDNLYDTIMTLPRDIVDSEDSAIIVPPFFFPKSYTTKCTSIPSCIQRFGFLLLLTLSGLQIAPRTMDALLQCYKKNICLSTKHRMPTHVLENGGCEG